MRLPDGRKSFQIDLAVLIQYRRVTDTQPATQPARHVAVAYTALSESLNLNMDNSCQEPEAISATELSMLRVARVKRGRQRLFCIRKPIAMSGV